MIKYSHFKSVKFLKAYATKKKGDILTCNTILAHSLVNERKVAEYCETPKDPFPAKKSAAKKGKTAIATDELEENDFE